MYVCMYVCTYVMYVRIYIRTYIRMYVHCYCPISADENIDVEEERRRVMVDEDDLIMLNEMRQD